MNHAFLIIAYNNPKLLARIVNRLKSHNHYIYIHIDYKSDIKAFKAVIPESDHLIYLSGANREKVYWGGLSLIMAEIHLMSVALFSDIKMDYLHLISGQDYPCRSNEDLDKFFEEHKGISFLNFDKKQSVSAHEWRYRKFHFNDLTYCDNAILNRLRIPISHIQSFFILEKEFLGFIRVHNGFLCTGM